MSIEEALCPEVDVLGWKAGNVGVVLAMELVGTWILPSWRFTSISKLLAISVELAVIAGNLMPSVLDCGLDIPRWTGTSPCSQSVGLVWMHGQSFW